MKKAQEVQEAAETPSHKVGIALILTLILPFSWNLFPASIKWGFPFFDNTTYSFAWQPIELRIYELRDIIPFYMFGLVGLVHGVCRGFVKDMHVYFFGKTIDIWFLYFLYSGMQLVDLWLAFLQIPYYRMGMTIIIILFHTLFLIGEKEVQRIEKALKSFLATFTV